MKATTLNAHIVPKPNYEIHRCRIILNMTWDMQVLYIKGEGYQATYFEGADPKIWSECYSSPEKAAFELDRLVNNLFGLKEDERHVQIGDRTPVPITGYDNAFEFADMFGGHVLTPINSI